MGDRAAVAEDRLLQADSNPFEPLIVCHTFCLTTYSAILVYRSAASMRSLNYAWMHRRPRLGRRDTAQDGGVGSAGGV